MFGVERGSLVLALIKKIRKKYGVSKFGQQNLIISLKIKYKGLYKKIMRIYKTKISRNVDSRR